ncbi:MAG: FtsX-like permease family protein [Pyrinomonadaceae bacterium]
MLGGIGVSNVTRIFIEQKRRAIAILKCVGGTGRQISAVYLLQMLALGAAGSLFGVALAKISLMAVGAYFEQTLPPNMSYGLQLGAVWQGLAMGADLYFSLRFRCCAFGRSSRACCCVNLRAWSARAIVLM